MTDKVKRRRVRKTGKEMAMRANASEESWAIINEDADRMAMSTAFLAGKAIDYFLKENPNLESRLKIYMNFDEILGEGKKEAPKKKK